VKDAVFFGRKHKEVVENELKYLRALAHMLAKEVTGQVKTGSVLILRIANNAIDRFSSAAFE